MTLMNSVCSHFFTEHRFLVLRLAFSRQSLSRWAETLTSGEAPLAVGTGASHKGHTGTWASLVCLRGQEWASYKKWSLQNLDLQASHLTGRKSIWLQWLTEQLTPSSGNSIVGWTVGGLVADSPC